MQTVLHDPYASTTESQRREAAARAARLKRLREARPVEIKKPAIPVIEIKVAEAEAPTETWEDRQRRIHGKPLWFSIEAEVDPINPRRPRVETIQAAVAKHYGVTTHDMISARRTAQVVRPRQVAYYLSKKLTLKSLPEIGRRFGGRDHTTALSGIRKIERLVAGNPDLKSEIEQIAISLGGSIA